MGRGLIVAVALLAGSCPAHAAISIPANQWVKQPTPSQVLLPGFSGTFSPRGWSHMLYDPNGQRMVIWDGYQDATRPYSIYANALWTYDVVNNRISLESVNNWTWQNNATVPLPAEATTPTPYDRHSYAAIAIAPDKNRLYLWGGANNTISYDWVADTTWTYDFGTHTWRGIGNDPTHPFSVFEQTMVYDTVNRKLVLFGGATGGYASGDRAWLFDVDAETWADASAVVEPVARMSQSMVFDPVRRVSWMFGGGYPYPNPGNELWTYDAAARTWQQINESAGVPPARRFGAMAYDSQHDIILLWGGILNDTTPYNDTWVLHPATQQWQQLTPVASPPAPSTSALPYSEDLAYDPVNNVFVLHQNGDFWLYRYAASTDSIPPAAVRDMVAH